MFDLSSAPVFNEALIKSPIRIRELVVNKSLNTKIQVSGGTLRHSTAIMGDKMSAHNREKTKKRTVSVSFSDTL